METIELLADLSKRFRFDFSKEKYLELLQKAISLRYYSPRNIMLIFIQNPNAAILKSYKEWSEQNRNINRTEHGIYIITPYKVEKILPPYDKTTTLIKFKPTFVFDISQTTTNSSNTLLDFEENDFQIKIDEIKIDERTFFDCLCELFDCHISYQRMQDKSFGFFSSCDNKYVLNLSLSDHVLIHSLLNLIIEKRFKKSNYTKAEKKLIAESIIYIIFCRFNFFLAESCADFFINCENEINKMDFEKLQNIFSTILNFSFETSDKILEKINEKISPKSDEPKSLTQKLNLANTLQNIKNIPEEKTYANFF